MDQVAALPYRVTQPGRSRDIEIMLVTSRDTGRWVVPKGNLMTGLSAHEAAALEALEEAGVSGAISDTPFGHFHYLKTRKTGGAQRLRVALFALHVDQVADTWSEQHQRERRWFAQGEAARAVAEPDLRALIATFRPGQQSLFARLSAWLFRL